MRCADLAQAKASCEHCANSLVMLLGGVADNAEPRREAQWTHSPLGGVEPKKRDARDGAPILIPSRRGSKLR